MELYRKRWTKPVWLVLALLLLAGAGGLQQALNRQRADPRLGLMRVTDLGSNAPPVLAFTTVALGGFRGLIANALWVRANNLQEEGKYFEMVQLADWITKLQPRLTQVWVVQAWNMVYNISVKFTDPADRYRWVMSGIELLRDEGLRYNPGEALVYRELAWFFQHKIGQNLDDAHVFYKTHWARDWQAHFESGRPNYEALLNPQTDAARRQARILREQYRMDPKIMREVDDQFGPLEWRLPDAHAIYWAWVGLKNSKKKDLITLRRVLYQSMHQIVLRGRILSLDPLRIAADLDKADRANKTYEQMIEEDVEMRHAIQLAHRNFLRETIYQLYMYNRRAEAAAMMAYARGKYEDLIPANLTVDEYAQERIKQIIGDMSQDRTRLVINGLITQYFISLALDDDAHAEGYDGMAQWLWKFFDRRISERREPLKFPPLGEMKQLVLEDVLNPENRYLTPEQAARLRTRLNLPPAGGNDAAARAGSGQAN